MQNRNLFDVMNPAPAAPVRPAPAARPSGPAVGSLAGVVELLGRARDAGLKYPKLWLELEPGSPLRIHVAGETSSTPGYLQLTDGGPFGANRWYGRVSPDGELEMGKAGRAVEAQLVQLLESLAADPASVAADYGHVTGSCCFCHRRLSDDRSVTVGYGPVCADKFGLPWGE